MFLKHEDIGLNSMPVNNIQNNGFSNSITNLQRFRRNTIPSAEKYYLIARLNVNKGKKNIHLAKTHCRIYCGSLTYTNIDTTLDMYKLDPNLSGCIKSRELILYTN